MTCPLCNDSRWKTIDVDGVERVVRCDCWRNAFIDRLLESARIPPRFARTELDMYQPDTDSQRVALKKARRFVESFPVVERGLLFHGPYGVGKTHLAVGILKEVIRKTGAKAFFFETPELLRQVRHTYNSQVDQTEMGVLKPILDADILVLDDLGAEKTSEWVQETLGLVINSRYNTRRPTILTSNLHDPMDNADPNSFMFQIGARTRSRLLEMCEWVEISGADIRDTERHTAAAETGQWPAPPENIKKGPLPGKSRGQVRAQLRDKAAGELKWSGGKAGSS
ncbi:MAG TPA: ATP-binding protein [Vicinamibacterales bacterium]|nr:ATP-binding protein [Vicinamibacterales bacterium]